MKIIRKGSARVWRSTCPFCHSLLEYTIKDIVKGTEGSQYLYCEECAQRLCADSLFKDEDEVIENIKVSKESEED